MLEHFGVPEYRRGLAHIKQVATGLGLKTS
jgi:hypothetical protein